MTGDKTTTDSAVGMERPEGARNAPNNHTPAVAIDRLRELALAAIAVPGNPDEDDWYMPEHFARLEPADAAYIADATPQAILSLIAENKAQAALLREKDEALASLVRDCLASDFNEHWESYTEARALTRPSLATQPVSREAVDLCAKLRERLAAGVNVEVEYTLSEDEIRAILALTGETSRG